MEVHIALIESDIMAVEKDLTFLDDIYQNLLENWNILKSDGIIVIASEYKRISRELKSVEKNIAFYNHLHSTLLGNFDKYRKKREEALKEYEEYKKIVESTQKVINFDISRRKK